MSDLTIGDQVLLLMLQRVHDGAITEFFGGYFEDGNRIFSSPVTSGFAALVETVSLYLQSSRPPELANSPDLKDHVNLSVADRTKLVRFTEKRLNRYRELSEARCAMLTESSNC